MVITEYTKVVFTPFTVYSIKLYPLYEEEHHSCHDALGTVKKSKHIFIKPKNVLVWNVSWEHSKPSRCTEVQLTIKLFYVTVLEKQTKYLCL